MLEEKNCDLIVCHVCHQILNDKDLVYEIRATRYDVQSCFFHLFRLKGYFNPATIIRFHADCFQKIAGKEYMFNAEDFVVL